MVGGSLWVLISKLYTYLLLGRGRDRMVVGFTTTHPISAYYHYSCDFESHLLRDVLNTTLYDKVCQ